MAKQVRPGKVFIDWSQNNAAKTTVAPYSLRARPLPTVSTPLEWDEVAACKTAYDLRFTAVVADTLVTAGGIAWSPDGFIYTSANFNGPVGLVRVPVTGGKPVDLMAGLLAKKRGRLPEPAPVAGE